MEHVQIHDTSNGRLHEEEGTVHTLSLLRVENMF
jgi:hypothetical protein